MFKDFFKATKKDVEYLREDSEKPIEKAIFNDVVKNAFIDFVKLNTNKNLAIIGGLALGAWARSRNTDDVDVMVLSENDIDNLEKDLEGVFKRTRKHAFEHKKTGVEIEIITSGLINGNQKLIKDAIENAKVDEVNGHDIKVVTPKYLIALKLSRASDEKNIKHLQDQFDILSIIKIYGELDLSYLPLEKHLRDFYETLLEKSRKLSEKT